MATYGYGNTAQNGGVSHKWTNKDDEINRTIGVITNRQQAGMDLTQQLAHYRNLTGQDYQLPQQPQQPKVDNTATVNSIYDNQLNAQLQALYASRDKAVGELNQQKDVNKATYQGQRNQADVVSAQNVQRLREIMASNGLSGSGENVTASVGLQNARQSALNGLNLQESQATNDINRQIADLNNPANEQALRASIEAQRAQALYGANRDLVEDDRWERNFATTNNQWQQQFNQSNNQFNQSLAFQKEQFASENAWREYSFNNMSASEKAQLEMNKSQFGEEMAWRMYELQYQGKIQTSNNQALINFYKTGKV